MLKLTLVLCATLISPALAQCTYSKLQQFTSEYISAQASGEFVTTASSASYTENFRPVNISTGLISQPLKVDYSKSLHDTTTCSTFTEYVVTDPSHPYVIGTQIKYTPDGSQITNIDSIVTDSDDWLFNATGTFYYASREDWFVIPEEQRDTRETIKAAADAYLDLFDDPSVIVPWGTPCARLEGGLYSGQGLPNDTCNVGVPTGVPIVNRRYVFDETVGSVDVFVDFGVNKIPDSHEFRVEGGKLRFVHTMSVTGPRD
ncbi:hypothetical protein FA13DRAFT_1797357 [Coprinellus micaceus]|uniref:DUF8021 domain-containing protein n=1 Tax=Coprinellus micaceus TaxID=71717 RepID=A0A4Y7SR31_COPMI|nr:hypothetical protein FA13DRAFT_1797357 [Coprinellus micaceus]